MTVLTFERFPVDPSRLADFERLANERIDAARSSAGILWADLARCSDDPPSYLLLVEWRTPADAEAFDAASDLSSFDAVLRGEVTRRGFSSAR